MEPRDAVLRVVRERDEPLHWTRIQDLALRDGYLDPFEHPDVRRAVQRALHELAREGVIVRVGKGVYRTQLDDDV
jgi:hypothetical protein